ncbi:hypothetical protein KKB71_01170 [Patescibacteria group bacterium]|nr:hypothetical protein [Patescibacteria group bacterium]MBU2219088.1 hypothetical protein [Patescibacteria group bacterium]
MSENLTVIPRVESRAPNKNTIEWEIPDKVLATLMLIIRVGYMLLVKVKKQKKHWWNKSWKSFSTRAADPATAVLMGLDFLKKHGYTIDHNSIKFGEKIGDPEYFKKMGM